MSKIFILLVLLSAEFSQFAECQQVNLVKTVLKLINNFNQVSDTEGNIATVFSAIVDDESEESKEISKNLNIISDKLNYMDNFITNKLQDVHNEVRRLPLKNQIQNLEDALSHHMQTVDTAYIEVSEALKKPKNVPEKYLQGLVSDHYNKVKTSVEDIQKHLAPSDDRGTARGLAESYQLLTTDNILHRCGSGTSPQQLLLGLYADITKTETKAMATLAILTKLQNLEEHAWQVLLKRYIRRHNAYIKSFSKAFDKALREYRSCDPDKQGGWKRGTSFFELERFNQATIFHRSGGYFKRLWDCNSWIEKVSPKQNWFRDRCSSKLDDACYMSRSEICHGTLKNCLPATVVERCKNTWVSPRRYIWLNDTHYSQFYGDADLECKGDGKALSADYGDSCICHCIEGKNKVSLELSLSNIGMNRVIIGIRLARENNTVFIQIKQGTLQPDGIIVNNSNSWEPSSPSQAPKKLFMFNNVNQGFNLDDLTGADDEVLTGIGFTRADGDSKDRVKLQIRVTKFNYTAGYLEGKSRIISSSAKHKTQLKIADGNPTVNILENVPRSSANETGAKNFVKFDWSSLDTDAGQTTLPLFDSVPIEGVPASPLSGAGLFHKNAPNYGGFLSLRVIGINIAKYFNDNFKTIPSAVYDSEQKSLKKLIEEMLLLKW